MKIRPFATGIVMVLAVVSAASAAPIVFSGSDNGANSNNPRPNSIAAAAAFDIAAAGVGSTTLITFESAPLGSFTNLVVAPGVTINGVDVGANPQTIVNAPVGTPDGLYGYNTTPAGSKFVSLFGGTLTFSFAPGVQGFGAYFSGIQLANETITFFDNTTRTIPIPTLSSGIAFVGFTDAGANIASIRVDVTGDIVGVDDVRVIGSAANTVPEPTSLVLLGSGVLLGLRRWRQQRNG